MLRSRLAYLMLVPVAFLLMGAPARAAPLADPAPIAVPAGLSAQDVSKAIRSGIVQRGWMMNVITDISRQLQVAAIEHE